MCEATTAAVEDLRTWDGTFDPDRVGAPLFLLWCVGDVEARQKVAAIAAAGAGVGALDSAAAPFGGLAGRLDVA